MTADDIRSLIEDHLPGVTATVTGEGGKFEAEVTGAVFAGLSPIKAHRLVNAAVAGHLASGALHALSIRTRAS